MSQTFHHPYIPFVDTSSQAISSTPSKADRPLKRKCKHRKCKHRNNGPQIKQSKYTGMSQSKRYLIGCAYIIYVREDKRSRDIQGNILPSQKACRPPASELSQKDMVELYFDNIDRSIVSQSKSKHVFAAPDWTLMHVYLFPWIHVHTTNTQFHPTRKHIKHIAFRIWEYLVSDGRVVIKHDDRTRQSHNIPLGDVRGWWLETDGDYPRGYKQWLESYDGTVPGVLFLSISGLTTRRRLSRNRPGGYVKEMAP